MGRYINQGVPSASTPWVGLIVGDDRIDGVWTSGRWDLRRNLGAGAEGQAEATTLDGLRREIDELRGRVEKLEQR